MAKSPKKSAKKSAKRSPAKKSPGKRGRPKGSTLSTQQRYEMGRKRSLTICMNKCQEKCEVANQARYNPTASQRKRASVRKSRASANPWFQFRDENQHRKPVDMKQSDWLKVLGAEYRKHHK